MPNGRSGWFHLAPTQLADLLKQHSPDTRLGKGDKEFPTPTVADVLRALERWRGGDVPIEQQDGSWYIIHLGPLGPWFIIGEGNSLLPAFHRAHVESIRRWVEEHRKGKDSE